MTPCLERVGIEGQERGRGELQEPEAQLAVAVHEARVVITISDTHAAGETAVTSGSQAATERSGYGMQIV